MKPRRLALAGLTAVAAISMGLSGCTTPTTETTTASPSAATLAPAKIPNCGDAATPCTIGSAVIVSHPALQAVQDGFEEVLKEEGINYTMIYQNAQGEQSNAATIASGFADNSKIDLILAISTPIATAMAQAIQDRPILFSAVTDPVEANLVPSWTQAGNNITGTSDLNPDAKPVSLIQEAKPGAKTVGVLYNSSEQNSTVQLQAYQKEAAGLGVTIKPQPITQASDLGVALAALAGVDAILVPTDNMVVAAMAQVISWGQENQVPVFCADPTQVAKGTVATRGPGYHDIGRATGEMAVKIIRDQVDIKTIAPVVPTSTDLLINPDAAKAFGLTLPDALVAQGTVVTTEQ